MADEVFQRLYMTQYAKTTTP